MQTLRFDRGIDGIPGFRNLAELTGHTLPDAPSAGDLDDIYDAWGKGKLFGDNTQQMIDEFDLGDVIPHQQVLDLLVGTLTLDKIPLRTLKQPVLHVHGSADVLLTGGTANLMQRRLDLLQSCRGRSVNVGKIYVLASSTRRCSTDTEVGHALVKRLKAKNGLYPTEIEFYQALLKQHKLDPRSNPPVEFQPGGTSLEPMLQEFAMRYRCENSVGLFVPCSANSLYVALMVLRIMHATHPTFGTTGGNLWFAQERIDLATTQDAYDRPAKYQRPLNVFSGLIRLAIELHKLQQSGLLV
ncbi:MAG TPA: hypothetical protein VFO38_04040 [Candidatus Saccharimonadales bacterium]|nr:hypothetical protein [Candidatus Saccharimonadales bacterium]